MVHFFEKYLGGTFALTAYLSHMLLRLKKGLPH